MKNAKKTKTGKIPSNVGYPNKLDGTIHSREELLAIEAKIGKNAPFSKLQKELKKGGK